MVSPVLRERHLGELVDLERAEDPLPVVGADLVRRGLVDPPQPLEDRVRIPGP